MSSSPIGLEGSDLSSINTMMSAVMSVGKVAENGGSPQSVKSPMKPPGPNRIGRRNQVSFCVLGGDIWWLQSLRTLGEGCSLEPQLAKTKSGMYWDINRHTQRLWSFFECKLFIVYFSFLCCGVSIGKGTWFSALWFDLIWLPAFFIWWPRQRI